MSANKRIAKNTILLYFRMMFIMGVTLFTSRIILKVLGVEDFGIYNVIGGVVALFSLVSGALSASTSRFLTYALGQNDLIRLRKLFNASLLLHVSFAVILFIVSETIGLWFLQNKMQIPENRMIASLYVFHFSVISCLMAVIQVPFNALIIAHEKMGVYAYVSILEAILKLAIAYTLLFSKIDNLVLYSLCTTISSILILVIYIAYSKRSFPETKIYFTNERHTYVELIKFSCWDLIGNFSVLAQGQGLNVLLNLFFGPVVNAARAISVQVQNATFQFSSSFITAVKPQIIKQYAEGNIPGMFNLVYNSSRFSYYLILVITVPLLLRTDYILTLWLVDYPEYTAQFTKLILINNLILSLKAPRFTVFHAIGEIKLTNIFTGLALSSVLPISYFMFKAGLPPVYAYIALIFSNIVAEFVSSYILRKYVNYSVYTYFASVHIRCLLVSVVSFTLPFLVNYHIAQSFFGLVAVTVISVVFVSLTVFCMGLSSSQRKSLVLKVQSMINFKNAYR